MPYLQVSSVIPDGLSGAVLRLAEEYDAVKEAGEVAGHGGARNFKVTGSDVEKPTIADIGLTKQEISEARQIRDAEKADPGVTRRTLDEIVQRGEEPTKAKLTAAIPATAAN